MMEERENRLPEALRQILRERYGFPAEEGDLVTGATVVKRSVFPNHTVILFCEDGFLDEAGQPYLLQARISHGELEGDRILALYRPDGKRYLFPAEEDALALIGDCAPEAVRNLDYASAKQIVHRKTLRLLPEPRQVSKEELQALKRSYAKIYKKSRLLAAGLLLTVCVFLIFLLLFSVLVSDKLSSMKESTGIFVLASFACGWLLCSVLVVVLMVKAPLLRLRRFTWKTECLVEGLYRSSGAGSRNSGAEAELIVFSGGTWRRCSTPVIYYDEPLLEEIRVYDTVLRYSRNPIPKDGEACLLIKKR